MKERASWPMKAHEVRAILDGRKTQARLVVKQATGPSLSVNMDTPGVAELSWLYGDGPGHEVHESIKRVPCPYGQPGDRLWVRESARCISRGGNGLSGEQQKPVICVEYAAGGTECFDSFGDWFPATGLKKGTSKPRFASSIHMPRWASRITLEITGVRVERLQDITEDDAWAEGVDAAETLSMGCSDGAVAAYSVLWEQINGPRLTKKGRVATGHSHHGWDANPWVWVMEFKRVTE